MSFKYVLIHSMIFHNIKSTESVYSGLGKRGMGEKCRSEMFIQIPSLIFFPQAKFLLPRLKIDSHCIKNVCCLELTVVVVVLIRLH